MDAAQFDRFTASLPRRSALGGVFALALGVSAAEAKKKKAKPNQFGCLNVGQPCRGKASQCCSGICEGKKPKKGKKDKRKCAGHNEGGCSPERNVCTAADPALAGCNANNEVAVCFATTGSGVFCGSLVAFSEATNCQVCARDSDCTAGGFPPGSACVLLSGEAPACANSPCFVTNFRACIPPGI
jgi:hypothetical protein